MAEEKAKSTSPGKAAAAKSKLNKVHFIATDRGLFPMSTLRKAEIEGKRPESKQAKQDYRYQTMKELVPLPFEVDTLLTLQENCTVFDAVVRQIAKDVVANGWRLVEAEEGKEGSEEEKKVAEAFLYDPNDTDETIDKIVERGVIDWGVTGWIAMEVSRDTTGRIDGIWHLPAYTIRVHKSKDKFYQKRGQQHVWFKRFGVEGNISAKTGKDISGPRDAANELIFIPNYYPKSDYYGVPNALSAVGSIIGLIGSRDYNLAFFENYGIPAAMVTLEGEWEEGSAKQITDFIDAEIRGSASAHKTLTLEIPETGKITWQPLGVEVKEGSFTIYTKSMRDEVLVAYRMPPYRVGIAEIGSLGGSTARESTAIYVQSIVRPLQKDLADVVTRMILKDGLEIETWRFEFNPIDIRDLEALTRIWKEWFGMGVINANYIRKEIGHKEEDHGNDYYVSATYLPVGEQSVEKREAGQIALMEDMRRELAETIKRINKAAAEPVASARSPE